MNEINREFCNYKDLEIKQTVEYYFSDINYYHKYGENIGDSYLRDLEN